MFTSGRLAQHGDTSGQVLLAAVGPANDPSSFGGTPYHLLLEGQRQGLILGDLGLDPRGWMWNWRRLAWNLATVFRGNGIGGYQYSVPFLEHLWSPAKRYLAGNKVLNLYQLYPPSVVADPGVKRWYYIDQTLLQLFDDYGIRQTIGRPIAAEALARELAGYLTAAGIICVSRSAAHSLTADYGIEPDRVSVVPRGANLHPDIYPRWANTHVLRPPGPTEPLRLVFVGKHPGRKGLDRLLRALSGARAAGANLTLRIIGATPGQMPVALRSTAGVEWVPYLDKGAEPQRYFDLVGGCHIGCLLSRAEAGGIGLREYHALGLAVIGPDVGGSPDFVVPGASRLVPPGAADAEITQLLLDLDGNRALVQQMRELSWEHREGMTWAVAVKQLAQVML